jgi:hypothetical protein
MGLQKENGNFESEKLIFRQKNLDHSSYQIFSLFYRKNLAHIPVIKFLAYIFNFSNLKIHPLFTMLSIINIKNYKY